MVKKLQKQEESIIDVLVLQSRSTTHLHSLLIVTVLYKCDLSLHIKEPNTLGAKSGKKKINIVGFPVLLERSNDNLLFPVSVLLFCNENVNNALWSCDGPLFWPTWKKASSEDPMQGLSPACLSKQPDTVETLCQKCLLRHCKKKWNVCTSITASLGQVRPQSLPVLLLFFSISVFLCLDSHVPHCMQHCMEGSKRFNVLGGFQVSVFSRKIHNNP